MRELFLDKPTAGGLVGIDELADFRVWLSTEKDMNMVKVVVPFFHGDIVCRSYFSKYRFESTGDNVIYDFPTVLNAHDQVIVKLEYRVIIAVEFQIIASLFLIYD